MNGYKEIHKYSIDEWIDWFITKWINSEVNEYYFKFYNSSVNKLILDEY